MTPSTDAVSLSTLLDLHPHPTVVHDADGHLVGANGSGEELLTARITPLGGGLPWDLGPDEDHAAVDLRVRMLDGTERWFTATSQRTSLAGRPVVVTSMVDLTERHQWAVNAIEGVIQRFQLSWAGSHLPVFLVRVDEDALGEILVGNAALQELAGAHEPVAGRHLSELFQMPGTQGREATDDLVRRLMGSEDGGPAVTSRIRCDDGTSRPVMMGLTAARGPLGRALFLLGYAIDQTPLEQLEVARRRDLVHTELVYEYGSDVVVVVSQEGDFRFIGPSSIDVLGLDRHELVGSTAFDLVHPDDVDLAWSAFGTALATQGVAEPVHLRIRDGHDRWRPVEIVARNLLDEPEVGGIVLTVRDRSEQARAEAELEQRELRYRQIVELAADGIASLDADDRIVFANQRLASMVGCAATELVGRSVFELLTAEDRDAAARHVQRAGADDDTEAEVERLRVQLRRSDGTESSAMIAATSRHDSTDVHTSVVWFTDLSEVEAARVRLERSEQRMRALFEAHPDLIFRLDDAGTYLDFHSTDASLLVLPPERFVGKTVHRVLSEDYAPGVADDFMKAIGEVLGGADIATVNYTLDLPDGPHRFEARMASITSDEVIAVVRDITDLHRSEQRRVEHERELVRRQAALERASLERELERASRTEAMGYLAATMAHDVNNLLGVIKNYSSAILRSAPDPVIRRDAEEISAAVGRGAELTQRLLSVGRRPSDPHVVEPIRDLVRDLSESLRGAFDGDGGADLVTELPEDPAHVRGSRPRLEQAVMNLVLNARDAAEAAGGRVVVTLSVESRHATVADWRPDGVGPGEYVVVSVVDGGGGIPEQVRERIFEPFFSTKDGPNSGLGLPIVREVAEQHGGGVGIHAVLVDGVPGTRMELWLPAVPSSTVAPAARVDGAPGARVLLVDDDDDVRRSTRHLLEGLGHHVIDVRGASGAVALVEGGEGVDLVLSDVRMPGTSGPELVRRLRALLPELPAVFLTGYADDLASAADLSDVPVLVKPYDVDDLARWIDRLSRDGERS